MNQMKIIFIAIFAITTGLFAYGPHGGLDCLGCHSTHFAIDHKLLAVKNTKMKNPLTEETLDKLVARNCLGCHHLPEYGGAGIRPIHLHSTHPIGMKPNPKIASVPDNLLKSGLLDCVSCHEVHPSNPNFAYLRVNVGKSGEAIQNLCATCHSAKVDLAGAGIGNPDDIQVFSAMDQEKGAGYTAKKSVKIENKTKEYIIPLGKTENDLMPNYQNPPSWVYAPEVNPHEEKKTETKKTEVKKAETKKVEDQKSKE